MKTWWRNINRNWKRILIANHDFQLKFKGESNFIRNEIVSKGLLNSYVHNFGNGLKSRCESFDDSEKNLQDLNSIKSLVIEHSGIDNLNPILTLPNLDYLVIKGNSNIKDYSKLWDLKSIKKLDLLDCVNLETMKGASKLLGLDELEITYCYNLKSIEIPKSLKKINIYNLGSDIDLTPINNVKEIIIHKRIIHPNDSLYNKIFNAKYKSFFENNGKSVMYSITKEEKKEILNSPQKANYLILLQQSIQREIELIEYSKWSLRIKTTDNIR